MNEIIHLINEMSPYLLLGFLLAGLMHSFIPGRYYTKFLAKKSFRSVINAALFGIPLPLCSCGVIPTAMSLRKEGASKGAVASFLIATPQTGVDSIIATFSLMGLPFAIVRPIAALLTAVFGGAMVNTTDDCKEKPVETSGKHNDHKHEGFIDKLREALEYAYIEMMEDIGKWLVIGLVIAGLITVFVPAEMFAIFNGNTLASMLLVLCIALPMYLCATGSIPIAVALMMKGLTPGAALVLLMAGPACNFASMLVIRKVLGVRTLITYLASIIVGSIAFGYMIDYLQFNGIVNFLEHLTYQQACCAEGDGWFEWACTILMILMLVNAIVLPKLGLRKAHHCHCHDGHHHDENSCSCGCESDECHSEQNVVKYIVEGMNCN
ncbi:MAG: permease, partial [Bacteroidaceae bacterium]|nr:permease [Bacteroidaceae bacterium]